MLTNTYIYMGHLKSFKVDDLTDGRSFYHIVKLMKSDFAIVFQTMPNIQSVI